MFSLIPDSLKQALVDGLVNFLAGQADRLADGTLGERLRGLSSDGTLRRAMDGALRRAAARFEREHAAADPELVAAIAALPGFWEGAELRRAVRELVARPGGAAAAERDALSAHLAAALPGRPDPARVERAVTALLRCVAEEVWAIPVAREIREVYALQLQRLSAEAVQRQAALAEQSLRAGDRVSAELRDAVLALLDHVRREPALALPPPQSEAQPPAGPLHNLPPYESASLVGREPELARLRALLAPDDRAWQILLLGVGGAGKSALARAIAHEYRERYAELPARERFEAIVWVSAKEQVLTPDGAAAAAPAGLIFRTLDDIYAAVAQVLGRADLAQAPPEERDRLVQQALAAQRTLLIVDNFESVTDERVRAFLRHLAPPTKALITSREWLDGAVTVRLGGLGERDAQAFLRDEAARGGVALSPAQAAAIARAATGLPLPLRLAVSRLESGERPEAVLRWLGRADSDLPAYCVRSQADLARTNDPRALSLLLACALFDREAGASPEALASVAGLDADDCDALAGRLMRLSLLASAGGGRLTMLPIVERYLQGVAGPEGAAIEERWLAWLVAFGQSVAAALDLRIELVDEVAREYPNLRQGIAWCRERGRHAELVALVRATWFYAELSGRFDEVQAMVEAAREAAAASGDLASRGFALRQLAWLRRLQGQDIGPTLAQLAEAEALAEQAGDEALLADIWYVSSDLVEQQGDLSGAEDLARRMLDLAEARGDGRIRTLAAYRLAKFALHRGALAEAIGWVEAAAAAAAALGWRRQLAWIAYRRGVTHLAGRDYAAAELVLAHALAEARAWDERRLQAYALQRLVEVYAATGRRALALQAAEDVRERFARLGVDRREFAALVGRLRGEDALLAELLGGAG